LELHPLAATQEFVKVIFARLLRDAIQIALADAAVALGPVAAGYRTAKAMRPKKRPAPKVRLQQGQPQMKRFAFSMRFSTRKTMALVAVVAVLLYAIRVLDHIKI